MGLMKKLMNDHKNNNVGDGSFVKDDSCNMKKNKKNMLLSSGVVGTSDDNVGVDTSGGTRDVGDELVEDISANKVVDSANVSGTVNLNFGIDTSVYSKRSLTYSFRVKMVDGLPTQKDNDCGAFVAYFAEYFIHSKEFPSDFSVKMHQNRFVVLLYAYTKMKEENNIASDNESHPVFK
ncbi:conserved hypothetical protein [Ricinus communis]|uniref:Ubiquitin-like protease family profile domain-containing protein n=1 Tax=Ricinus communis TaxID=3988 RepID=B9SVA6_RICCO|nr:conserved hypothetical protein [Ricinus communis]